MMHKIQCKCGSLQGHVEGTGTCCRVVCYCSDCQAFAKYLGRAHDVLDSHGGTEIVQVAQPRVAITKGKQHLTAMRLSDKGLIRWYSACCNTPIGNTLAQSKISFIGLIHSCLEHSKMAKDFGGDISIVNVGSAYGEPKPIPRGLFRSLWRFVRIILSTLISGRYRQSQFFNESGNLIVTPKVLTDEELKQLKESL